MTKFVPKPGDIVQIEKNGEVWSGRALPSKGSRLNLKLNSGYNVGIDIDKGTKIEKLGEAESIRHRPVKFALKHDRKKPRVSVLSAGGTIASSIDYSTGAISASYSADDLMSSVPEVSEFANIDAERIFEEMSENLTPKDWQIIARAIFKKVQDKNISGIVVTHGTDTLSFSTAMMSFMLRNLNKPVVFTYSQKSSDRGSTDAAMNLICSTITAAKDIAEVVTVGHGTVNDDYCLINRGNKVRKMHSSQRNTFRPINCHPIGKVWPDGKVEIISEYKKSGEVLEKPYLADKLEERIAIVKFYPGLNPEIIDWYIDKGYKGLIIEGTGLGHVNVDKMSLVPAIKKAIEKGILVCMTTQTIYGSVNPYVYSNLRRLSEKGVLYLRDMLTDTAYVKLMWSLGQAKSLGEAKEMMLENIAGEFNPRLQPDMFLY